MPLYFLYPRRSRKHDRRWNWSYHHGSCLVVAEDDRRARSTAAAAFTQVTAEPLHSSFGAATLVSPWFDPDLVALRPVPESIRTDLPMGSVVAAGHACSFARAWNPAPLSADQPDGLPCGQPDGQPTAPLDGARPSDCTWHLPAKG